MYQMMLRLVLLMLLLVLLLLQLLLLLAGCCCCWLVSAAAAAVASAVATVEALSFRRSLEKCRLRIIVALISLQCVAHTRSALWRGITPTPS